MKHRRERDVPTYRVRVSDHAKGRWAERAGCHPNNVERLFTALLIEQYGVGIPMRNKQPILLLSAERFGLEQDVMVPLELPDIHGVWVARTILEGSKAYGSGA